MEEPAGKASFEPFRIFGADSNIWSVEEAEMVLRKATYYIYFAGGFLILLSAIQLSTSFTVGYATSWIFAGGIVYLVLGVGVQKHRSKGAAVMALLILGGLVLQRLHAGSVEFGFGVPAGFLLMAYYRAFQAAEAYHRLSRGNVGG